MTMMKVVQCFDSEDLWQPDSTNQCSLTCNTDCQHLCRVPTVHQQYTHADVPAKASLSRSKPLLISTLPHSEVCTWTDELSQFHPSRDKLCHHHHTTLSFSLIVTRGFITIRTASGRCAASDYCAQFHEFLFRRATRKQLCCFHSVSPSAAPADRATWHSSSWATRNFG